MNELCAVIVRGGRGPFVDARQSWWTSRANAGRVPGECSTGAALMYFVLCSRAGVVVFETAGPAGASPYCLGAQLVEFKGQSKAGDQPRGERMGVGQPRNELRRAMTVSCNIRSNR